jgi:hypothetical protein
MPTVTYMDEAVRQVLTADAGIAALAGLRIFSTQAPQGTALPCIVYMQDQNDRSQFMHMRGMTGLARVTYTIACLGTSLVDVRNLSRTVRAALQYKQSDAIRLAVVKSEDDTTEPGNNGEQLPVYRTDLSVEITFLEP